LSPGQPCSLLPAPHHPAILTHRSAAAPVPWRSPLPAAHARIASLRVARRLRWRRLEVPAAPGCNGATSHADASSRGRATPTGRQPVELQAHGDAGPGGPGGGGAVVLDQLVQGHHAPGHCPPLLAQAPLDAQRQHQPVVVGGRGSGQGMGAGGIRCGRAGGAGIGTGISTSGEGQVSGAGCWQLLAPFVSLLCDGA
jgi:hypothetical protein